MNEKEEFARQFRQIQPKFSRIYTRLLTEARLSFPQFALLSQLVDRGTVSMTEISEKLHITKPAVTSLADRLEKGKFLKRLAHPTDRRVSLLEIQPKGERVVRKTQVQASNFLLETLDQLNASERKTVARFYQLLSHTLDKMLVPSVIAPPALSGRRPGGRQRSK